MPDGRRSRAAGPARSRSCAAGVLVLAMGVSSLASAGDRVDPFELSPEELFAATVVSATKTEQPWRDTPAAVYVLTAGEIARSGASTVPDALRFVPGVEVSRFNASGWAVSVRGFNNDLANKLLVLVDGREVYNQLFSGVYWDIQDVPLAEIDRIEVVRGPGASLWGANAVNGVINIVTKSAHETRGTRITARGGDEAAGLSAQHSMEWGRTGDLRFFGTYRMRDGQRGIGGGGGKDGWTAFRGGFRGDWVGDDGASSYTLQGNLFRSRAKQLRPVALLEPPFSRIDSERVVSTGWHLLGRYARDVGQRSRLTVQTYLDHMLRRTRLVDDDFHAADIDVQLESELLERVQLVAGAAYRRSISRVSGSPAGAAVEGSRRTDDRLSAFVQARWSIVPDRLALTAGSKLERNDYSGTEIQPSAQVQWTPDADTMIWASIARAVRRPSRLEHDLAIEIGTIPPGAFPVPVLVALAPNRDFDSEKLVAYELGFRRSFGSRVSLDLATFYNRYRDLAANTLGEAEIVPAGADPLHIRLPVLVRNSTRARAVGAELVVAWQALPSLRLSASASHLNLELSGPPSDVAIDAEAAEGRSPTNQLGLRALWDVGPVTRIDTSLYYVDELSDFDVDPHWKLDLRVSRKVSDRLTLGIVGQDLLGAAHREFFERSVPFVTEVERSVYAEVTWVF